MAGRAHQPGDDRIGGGAGGEMLARALDLGVERRDILLVRVDGTPFLDTYLEPGKTFGELREMAHNEEIDLLGDFAEACRTEQESLSAHQF